jgi:hypothetical protein
MKTHFLRFACSRGFQRLALYPCKYSKIRSKKKQFLFLFVTLFFLPVICALLVVFYELMLLCLALVACCVC